MGKYLLCKYLAELYAFLVKAVDIPYKALEHYFVLEVCQKGTQSFGRKLLTDDGAGGASSLKVLVLIVISLTAGKGNNLCCHVCAELLLAGTSLNIYIRTNLTVLKSNELERCDICSLMQ